MSVGSHPQEIEDDMHDEDHLSDFHEAGIAFDFDSGK
jgi:hypothetical protein